MSGITIVYDGNRPKLAEAVANANTILNSGNLLSIIRGRKKRFFNTERTCDEIADAIGACSATITLDFFTRAPYPNGNITTAYVTEGVRDIIHYNTNITGWGAKSQTNTLVHEAVHVVDYFHDRISAADFTHDGNNPSKPKGNKDSAPYWIGNRAEELVDLLDDHVGQEKLFATLDSVDRALVKRYLTEENWAARKGFLCEPH